MLDAIIIGGGPAGLSAALILARCRRKILVIDSEQARNRWAKEVHGFLTRDCTPPGELRALALRDLARYDVPVVRATARRAERTEPGFRVTYSEGGGPESIIESVLLMLATGVEDALPEIRNLERFYGVSVHHCPYCDGWEHRDERLVAFGDGDAAIGLALSLRTWSEQVTACTNGRRTSDEKRSLAAARGIIVLDEPVESLDGDDVRLRRVIFRGGESIGCDALFFNADQWQRSDLPRTLGCSFRKDGGVETDSRQCTGVPGLYLAGDADKDVQFAIVAAAEGATAATAMNRELQEREQRRALDALSR